MRRYKRFLADVTTSAGETLTIHCPNTGAMSGCSEPGSRVWYSTSDNPKRKYPNTLEIVRDSAGHNIGVNSAFANTLVEEALISEKIEELGGYSKWKREAAIPALESRGRFDFALMREGEVPCFVEVKSLSLHCGGGLGAFPDVPSERARRHIEALLQLKRSGHRCVLFFCVQHSGIERVTVAGDIDPDYAEAVRTARNEGVEILAYASQISPIGITLTRPLPVLL